MKILKWSHDGGETSGVRGFFIIEIKPIFSIVLLRFNKGTREAFHEHAFSAVTLWLKGAVREHHLEGHIKEFYAGQCKLTPRSTFHKIEAMSTAWAISVRGPWVNRWREWRNNCFITLTHGRKQL